MKRSACWSMIDFCRTGLIGSLIALYFISSVATAREPSDFEQFMLELINRAREDPDAEVVRTASSPQWAGTPDLNEGLAPGTISNAPKQPLVFNTDLIDSASDYSDLLLANNELDHYYSGDPESRMDDAGYSFVPGYGWAENLSVAAGTPGTISITEELVDDLHTGLFADKFSPTRGHRTNLMAEDLREIGIGVRFGEDYTYFGPTYDAVLVTQDFAYSAGSNSGDPFLTGVAYNDLDLDSFYSTGEGLSLTVEAYEAGTSNLLATTTTFASGGYTLGGLASGMLDVRFYGSGVDETFDDVDFTSGLNVKLDAIDPMMASLLGDISGDGEVDIGDFTLWADAFGATGAGLPEDLTGDSEVDIGDFTLWADNFGNTLGVGGNGPGLASVPEPSAFVLFTLGTVGFLLVVSRRRTTTN